MRGIIVALGEDEFRADHLSPVTFEIAVAVADERLARVEVENLDIVQLLLCFLLGSILLSRGRSPVDALALVAFTCLWLLCVFTVMAFVILVGLTALLGLGSLSSGLFARLGLSARLGFEIASTAVVGNSLTLSLEVGVRKIQC